MSLLDLLFRSCIELGADLDRLQWGPVSQTVAIMSLISLGERTPSLLLTGADGRVMSVSPLPPEMDYFYMLFSRMTICAVM